MNKQHECDRLRVRLNELASWQILDRIPLEGRFQTPDMPASVPIHPGEAWPSRSMPAQFQFTCDVPKSWAGQPVMVRLAVGGEGLLLRNGNALGGLTPYHREHLLIPRADGGERMSLTVEAVPRGPLGLTLHHPRFEEACLIIPDPDVRPLLADLAAALDAARALDDEPAMLIIDLLSQTFREISLPRGPTESYLARIACSPDSADAFGKLWEEWRFTAAPVPLPESGRVALRESRERFHARLGAIRKRYPPIGALSIAGHAHIDVAWLWPVSETRRKARRTFSSVCALMDRYPEFTFAQSMAQLYSFVEQDDPELFARIQARVREGRWEPVGGMWVESDGNLLSGESWVRQVLYGQKYFESRFGKRSRVAWLPDTFGFAANLPQIFRGAGMDFFFTTKLAWNETNPFPHDLYWWEGLDGSRILAHLSKSPNGYNSTLEAEEVRKTWNRFLGKRYTTRALVPFGRGDGGGGPTEDMLERARRSRDFPGLPGLAMQRTEDFFQEVDGTRLPVWVGEHYLELHRATYTSQSQIKLFHRRLEHVLPEAEIASTLAFLNGQNYPSDSLERCWHALLRNQFHDILPGSGIHTMAREAREELNEALHQASSIREAALTELSRETGALPDSQARMVVWNLSLDDRPLQAAVPRPDSPSFRLLAPDGKEVPYQLCGDHLRIAGDLTVPGLGYTTLSVVPGRPTAVGEVTVTGHVLENRFLRVEVAKDGTLRSVYDKENQRESLSGRGNQLWAYTDIPREWEAWDVDASYETEGHEILSEKLPEIVESGSVRAGLRALRRLGQSTIEQTYWLGSGSRRLEIETHIQWNERRTLLRALFPLQIRAHEAWFETAFGAVSRPTHRNTSWDSARFEVPALRFADMSEEGYGVSLINDGRYGHSALGNVLGLSLLRGPISPDPLADHGEHTFTYAFFPHAGDWRYLTPCQAHDMNAPLQGVILPGRGGSHPPIKRFAGVNCSGLRLSALKRSDSGKDVVLRLYEAHGGRGTASIHIGELGFQRACRANLLEDPAEPVAVQKGTLSVPFTPHQILSFTLSRL